MHSLHPRKQELIKLLTKRSQKSRIQVRKRVIYSIDQSPCGKYVACAANHIVISYDLLQQKQIAQSEQYHRDAIWQVRYSQNGILIASASFDNTIILWNASTLNQIGKKIEGHQNFVISLTISPDSQNFISGSLDQSIILWDVRSQEQVGENLKVGYSVSSVEYSHNGLQFLSAGQCYIDIWDSKTRQLLYKLTGHKSQVNTATYSFDDRQIVSGDNCGGLKIWDAITGQQIGDDMVGHVNSITSVAFSPDQKFVVSGSRDNTIRLWNCKTGKQESLLHTHNGQVNSVRFTNDGRYILSGSADQSIRIIKIRKIID